MDDDYRRYLSQAGQMEGIGGMGQCVRGDATNASARKMLSSVSMVAYKHLDGRCYVRWQCDLEDRHPPPGGLMALAPSVHPLTIEGEAPDYQSAAVAAQSALEDLTKLQLEKDALDRKYSSSK